MTAPALVLTDKIGQTSQKTRNNRILTAQFGHGFGQYAQDGVNSQNDLWQVVWPNLTSTDWTTATTFYNTVGADVWWTWTPPGEATSKKWRIVAGSWQETGQAGNIWTIQFQAQQVFDLGT